MFKRLVVRILKIMARCCRSRRNAIAIKTKKNCYVFDIRAFQSNDQNQSELFAHGLDCRHSEFTISLEDAVRLGLIKSTYPFYGLGRLKKMRR